MATTNPGTFVLEVAETGKSLMTAYTRFITYRKVADRRLENLYATLSLTTNTLTEIGTNINKYQNDFPIKDEVTRPICETCKTNFDKFLVLIKEGTSSGVWKNDGTLGGEAVTAEIDPWFLITMSLGGRDEAKAFWKSLDNTRDAILELNDVIRYMTLKDLSKKNKLNKEQAEDFKDVTALLPHLIQRLKKSEKTREADAEEAAREAARKAPPPPPPPFNRKDSDAASERTLFVEPKRNVRPPFAKDIDCQSISSFTSSSSGSSSDDEPTEIYEEWILRWNEPTRNVNRSWGVFGIRFKSYFEEEGFWGTDPEYRTQEEMKEQEKFASADLSPAKHREAMQKTIRSIPKEGGFCIDTLIEERTEATSNEDAKRQWSVVAVRPKQKFPYAGSKKKWGKNPEYTDWLVTIKGETVDMKERSRSFRRDNPFRQRSRSPVSIRNSPRQYPIRNRSPSPIRRGLPPPPAPFRHYPPPPPPAAKEAVPDEGFRPGALVIGKILSPEAAEKKIEEIWTKMNEDKVTEEEEVLWDRELVDD